MPPPSVSIACDTKDLELGPDPRFGASAENGACSTQVANLGGSWSFQANNGNISITNNGKGTANYTDANMSANRQDTSITVTYQDPFGGPVSATFSGITVHKPSALFTNSTTPNDHTITCTLPCLANPNSGSCNVTPGTSCSYAEPITRRSYSILDQFGDAFEVVHLSSAGTITESVTPHQGSCSGNDAIIASFGGSPFPDNIGKCDSCCEPGGPGCQSSANQTIFVNGYTVRTELILVNCQQATFIP